MHVCLLQNSTISPDHSEMESLRKECEIAKKKCKDAQEKYFSESDRLKAIIDEMQGIVNSLYYGHPRDRGLVSLKARVRNSGNLFQANVSLCNLFLPRI